MDTAVSNFSPKGYDRHAGIVAIDDDQSAYFPDGSNLVRVERLPWTSFTIPGSDPGPTFKLLTVNWAADMYFAIVDVPGSLKVEPHYHLGEAYGYLLSGMFEYEYGRIYKGDFMNEGADIEHAAKIGSENVPHVSVVIGGLCGVNADGGPDLSKFVGCAEMYRLAMENGAADHVRPPPAGWRSPALERYERMAAAAK